jgi:hypothetical protein
MSFIFAPKKRGYLKTHTKTEEGGMGDEKRRDNERSDIKWRSN